jgi:DNA polymerase-4
MTAYCEYQLKGRTITLKIKYSDFRQITRSQSLPACIDDIDTILNTSKALLAATDTENSRIRLTWNNCFKLYPGRN